VLAVSLVVFGLLVYYAAANIFYQRQEKPCVRRQRPLASAYMQELEEEQSIPKANEVVLAEMVFRIATSKSPTRMERCRRLVGKSDRPRAYHSGEQSGARTRQQSNHASRSSIILAGGGGAIVRQQRTRLTRRSPNR
jgi:hypothetical protein